MPPLLPRDVVLTGDARGRSRLTYDAVSMGLFDRKRQAPEPDPVPEAKPEVQQQAQTQPAAEPKPAAAPSSSVKKDEKSMTTASDYGIQKAIELMRNLPADNIPLVVQVVRTTLESTNIDVPSIIGDAKAKRARIATRIDGLRKEIAEYEEEIGGRRKEIAALEADGAETKTVQERLELAMKADEEAGKEAGEDAGKDKSPPAASEPVPSRVIVGKSSGSASIKPPVFS